MVLRDWIETRAVGLLVAMRYDVMSGWDGGRKIIGFQEVFVQLCSAGMRACTINDRVRATTVRIPT
jgi:hypothetical protein